MGFPGGSVVKNLPANAGDAVDKDPLEEDVATHSSILAGIISRTEETGGLQSMGCKESDKTEHTCIVIRSNKMYLKVIL